MILGAVHCMKKVILKHYIYVFIFIKLPKNEYLIYNLPFELTSEELSSWIFLSWMQFLIFLLRY